MHRSISFWVSIFQLIFSSQNFNDFSKSMQNTYDCPWKQKNLKTTRGLSKEGRGGGGLIIFFTPPCPLIVRALKNDNISLIVTQLSSLLLNYQARLNQWKKIADLKISKYFFLLHPIPQGREGSFIRPTTNDVTIHHYFVFKQDFNPIKASFFALALSFLTLSQWNFLTFHK